MMTLPLLTLLAVAVPAPEAATDTRLGLTAGLQLGRSNAGGPDTFMVLLTGELRLFQGPWVFGLGSDLGGGPFAPQEASVVASAGRRFLPVEWLSLELGAEGGVHHLWAVGQDLFASSSGANTTTLPFLGARAGVDLRLPVGSGALLLGVMFRARTDLGQATVRPTVSSFGTETVEAHQIGGQSAYGGLRLGFEL